MSRHGARVRLFLLTVHAVFAAGAILAFARAPESMGLPATSTLLVLALVCTGLWLRRRWTVIPASALGLTAGLILATATIGTITWPEDVLRRATVALIGVIGIEIVTVLHALGQGSRKGPE